MGAVVKHRKLTVLLLTGLLLFPFAATAQNKENKKEPVKKEKKAKKKEHSAKKATRLAIIPGAGQIYNKKYWKVPIVYAGFGAIGYFAFSNRNYYKTYGEAYTCKVTNPDCTNELAQKYSEQDLITLRDYYRRNMELSFIIMGGWYVLQMLDAMVDATLYNWEVDDELSISVKPAVSPLSIPVKNNTPFVTGISIRIGF